jgi:hypothetical protein
MFYDCFLGHRSVAATALLVQFREQLIAATELSDVESFNWTAWMWCPSRTVIGWANDLFLDYGM